MTDPWDDAEDREPSMPGDFDSPMPDDGNASAGYDNDRELTLDVSMDDLVDLLLEDETVNEPDLEFLLVPLLTEAEQQMVGIERPLDAEMWASELLGMLELGDPDLSAEDRTTLTVNLATRLVEHGLELGTATGLAMLRALSVIGPESSRKLARTGARQMLDDGLPDTDWAARVGRPEVGRCWRFADPEGTQESLTITFGYGESGHTLTVLVDHQLGGGVKDCWIGEDPDAVLAESRTALADQGITIEFVPLEQIRSTLLTALSRPECPRTPDEAEDVALSRALLRARSELLLP